MNLLHWNSENILAISNFTPITKEQLLTEYKPVFDRRLEGDYHLVVYQSCPPVVHPPRKVPISIPLKAQLKSELNLLENLNIITQVSEPTPWVSSCLMVVKPNMLWICIDPKGPEQSIDA